MQRTSVTDVDGYREFCYMASRHDEIFKNFKSNPICRWAIEYASGQQGRDYFLKILSNADFKISFEQFKNFLLNDAVGGPVLDNTYQVSDLKITCSPTTLRYIKVLSDIVTYFDIDKIKSVSEIGVGYGGQCRILKCLLDIKIYNLIDLPEVLMLAEKFLDATNTSQYYLGGGLRFIDGTHLYHEVESDFFISNYAFSELQTSVQDAYIEKVVSKSKAGYITWDGGFAKSYYGVPCYGLEEILKKLPNPKVIPEDPVSTDQSNCIIMWGVK